MNKERKAEIDRACQDEATTKSSAFFTDGNIMSCKSIERTGLEDENSCIQRDGLICFVYACVYFRFLNLLIHFYLIFFASFKVFFCFIS